MLALFITCNLVICLLSDSYICIYTHALHSQTRLDNSRLVNEPLHSTMIMIMMMTTMTVVTIMITMMMKMMMLVVMMKKKMMMVMVILFTLSV